LQMLLAAEILCGIPWGSKSLSLMRSLLIPHLGPPRASC
jgi:hypothetical protein